MIPLLAPPLSCSSLFAAMLGQHPELYASAELECFTGSTLLGCQQFAERVPVVTLHGLLRSLAQLLHGEQSDAAIAEARQWLDQRLDWSGAELVGWIETVIAPRRLVEKSPIHVLRRESLARLVGVVKWEPMLHLVRHPLIAMASLRTAYQRSGRSLTAAEALTSWATAHTNILRFTAELTHNPTLVLRCEELLAEPEANLVRVCGHLGVDASPAAITAMLHPEYSPYAFPGPPSAPSGNDPHWMHAPALRRQPWVPLPPLSELWLLEDLEPQLVLRVMSLAEQFGYV